MRESDPALVCPIEHGAHDRPRLTDEGYIALRRHQMRAAGIQMIAWRDDPEAIRTDDAHRGRLRRRKGVLQPCSPVWRIEAGIDENRRAATVSAEFGDNGWNSVGVFGDDRQIGRSSQLS